METRERRLHSARILVTFASLIYGVLPLLADLSPTHVLHPDWTPHARFHTVWLLATNTSLAALSLWLLWRSRLGLRLRVRLAGALGVCVLGGFCVAALTTGLYGGALADPEGGVPTLLGLDLNLLVFAPTLGLVGFALWRSAEGDPA